jgi:signal transduction histidine kinase
VLPQSTPRLAAGASPELAQEIASLERLASAGAEGLVGADTHGRCVFRNDLANRLVGSAAAQDGLAISAYLSSLFQFHRVMADDGSAVVDTPDIAALAASGRWLRFTSPAQSAAFPEGERQYALVPYPLKNERGALIGYALFIRDITRLIQDESLGNGLLSSVSHDLRTPLMVIKAAVTGLLQEGLQWDEALRRETLQDINEETDRLTSLVSALLEMSRIQGGVLQLQTEWCDLAEIVHTVLDRLQKVTGHHRMVYDVSVSLPLIQGDYMQLDRVLSNLIENAVKYSPEGTEIRVMARLEGAEVQVSVLDQGRGVPPEARERIFEKFYRVKQQGRCPKRSASLDGLNQGLGEAHTRPLAGGLGLGLAICRGIVLAHHGRIWVEASPEGGSRFAFALPVEQEAPITGRVAHDSGPFLAGAMPPTTSEQAELLDMLAADDWDAQKETAGAD